MTATHEVSVHNDCLDICRLCTIGSHPVYRHSLISRCSNEPSPLMICVVQVSSIFLSEESP